MLLQKEPIGTYNGRMPHPRKYVLAYVSAFFAFLALGFFFLPLVYVPTAEGTPIYVFGFTLAFGGEIIETVGESVYSLSFSTNIFALVLLMCLLLAGVASVLSKESAINRIAAAVLAVAGSVLVFVLPNQIGQSGLQLAYGAYLCIGFALLSMVFDILAFIIRPKKAL